LENFPSAINVYKDLHAGQDAANEQNDLRINTSAVDAQLEWQGLGYLASNRTVQKDDMQAFERAYNAACGCIARSKFQEAEILLARAKRMMKSEFEIHSDMNQSFALLQRTSLLSKRKTNSFQSKPSSYISLLGVEKKPKH